MPRATWSELSCETWTDGDPCVCCRIGDFAVSMRSDLQQVLEDFAGLYPGLRPDQAANERPIHIDVCRSGRSWTGRRLYQVYADGKEVGGRRAGNGVFPMVEWGINLRTIARKSKYLQLHAASMTHQGQGFVFAGDSGCGKSTLAAVLLARGWKYLCDEFALIDLVGNVLHPFPKALCIKAGSFPVLRRLGLPFARRCDYVKAFKGRVGYINPLALGVNAVGGPAPVRFLIFPTYRVGVTPCLHTMPRSRAVLNLMRCCFNRHALADGGLPTLTQFVSQVECYRMDVGEPAETRRLLESLVGGPSTSQAAAVSSRVGAVRGGAVPSPDESHALRSRREMLRLGTRLAYVVPVVLTLSATQAFATESNFSAICSGVPTGGLCETDTDCCSGDCDVGVCQ